jgi:pyruvate,orthophosphate dikinase
VREFQDLQRLTVDSRVAAQVMPRSGIKRHYLIGTMIETRARAHGRRIAEQAEFFSFGTNDLTQMTFGFSRDDVGPFLPAYQERGRSYEARPVPPRFDAAPASGQLVASSAVQKGRAARPDEAQAAESAANTAAIPKSVAFFHRRSGLDYVSARRISVPIARLAAAQAAIAG